jgi:prepilin-type N-terminal cleavage/methylation domain-containing protein
MTSPLSSHEHAHAENTKHDVSPRKNVFFILFGLITGFTLSFFGSIRLFFVSLFSSNARPLRENEFLKVMDFTLNAGPRSFWRFPTAIKIGRSIATFLSFVFDRNRAFTIKKTHTQKKGFTLIELLASITIIAIVVLVAYATLQHVSIS